MSDFSAAATAAAVHATMDQALAVIPPGKRGALLGQVVETANGPQAEAIFVEKISTGWAVTLGGAFDKTGPSAKFGVMGSW